MTADRNARSVVSSTPSADARAKFDAVAARLVPVQVMAVAGPPGPRYPYPVVMMVDPLAKGGARA